MLFNISNLHHQYPFLINQNQLNSTLHSAIISIVETRLDIKFKNIVVPPALNPFILNQFDWIDTEREEDIPVLRLAAKNEFAEQEDDDENDKLGSALQGLDVFILNKFDFNTETAAQSDDSSTSRILGALKRFIIDLFDATLRGLDAFILNEFGQSDDVRVEDHDPESSTVASRLMKKPNVSPFGPALDGLGDSILNKFNEKDGGKFKDKALNVFFAIVFWDPILRVFIYQ